MTELVSQYVKLLAQNRHYNIDLKHHILNNAQQLHFEDPIEAINTVVLRMIEEYLAHSITVVIECFRDRSVIRLCELNYFAHKWDIDMESLECFGLLASAFVGGYSRMDSKLYHAVYQWTQIRGVQDEEDRLWVARMTINLERRRCGSNFNLLMNCLSQLREHRILMKCRKSLREEHILEFLTSAWWNLLAFFEEVARS